MTRFLSLAASLVLGVMILVSHDVVMALDPHRDMSGTHDGEHGQEIECGVSQGATRPAEDGFDTGSPDSAVVIVDTSAMASTQYSLEWSVPVLTGSVLRAMLQVYLN